MTMDISRKVVFSILNHTTMLTFIDEMLSVIEGSGSFVQDKMEEAKKCIKELDVDCDGKVSYPEFLLIWRFRD